MSRATATVSTARPYRHSVLNIQSPSESTAYTHLPRSQQRNYLLLSAKNRKTNPAIRAHDKQKQKEGILMPLRLLQLHRIMRAVMVLLVLACANSTQAQV